jgi:hypothetical protein
MTNEKERDLLAAFKTSDSLVAIAYQHGRIPGAVSPARNDVEVRPWYRNNGAQGSGAKPLVRGIRNENRRR